MTLLFLVAVTVAFSLGALIGAELQDRVHESERRCRAMARRRQADELRRLRDYAAACEEAMRWHTKRQAGLVVIDYEEAN